MTRSIVAKPLVDAFRSGIQFVAELLLPPRCPLCEADDFEPAFGVSFCPDCEQKLCPALMNRCRRCDAEIGPYATSEEGCVHCRQRTFRFDSVTCLGMYDDSLRKALLSAKWSWSAVRMMALGRLLMQHRQGELQAVNADVVVPIPQSWPQRLSRHFNPAWIVAEELAKGLRRPCLTDVLLRSRRTRPQKRVSVSQRFENQAKSFKLRTTEHIAGKRVLIVDDVLTTGATISEAAKTLKAAGAISVHAAVVARVLDHSA